MVGEPWHGGEIVERVVGLVDQAGGVHLRRGQDDPAQVGRRNHGSGWAVRIGQVHEARPAAFNQAAEGIDIERGTGLGTPVVDRHHRGAELAAIDRNHDKGGRRAEDRVAGADEGGEDVADRRFRARREHDLPGIEAEPRGKLLAQRFRIAIVGHDRGGKTRGQLADELGQRRVAVLVAV